MQLLNIFINENEKAINDVYQYELDKKQDKIEFNSHKAASVIYNIFKNQFSESSYNCSKYNENPISFCVKVQHLINSNSTSILLPITQRVSAMVQITELLVTKKIGVSHKTAGLDESKMVLFSINELTIDLLKSGFLISKEQYIEKKNAFLDLFKGIPEDVIPTAISKKLTNENPEWFFLNYQQDMHWRRAYDYLTWANEISCNANIPKLEDICIRDLYNDNPSEVLNIIQAKFSRWMKTHAKALLNVKSIYLSSANLTYIPSEIKMLSNLEILDLSRNKFQEVPSEIGLLNKLYILSFQYNRIKEISFDLANLKELSVLNFGSNQIKHVPKQVGELSNLKSLYFGKNQITNLPLELKDLPRVRYLVFKDNPIVKVQAELKNLPALQL